MIVLFGSTQSYIGLAESKSLLGEYKQIGAVHISHDGEFNKPNAIDPKAKTLAFSAMADDGETVYAIKVD